MRNIPWLIIMLTVAALALDGCATGGPVKAIETPADLARISEEEARLWAEANDMDEAIRRSDQVHGDKAVAQYLQDVMDRLYPGFKSNIEILVLKSSILNAFALPNGSIYINIGLLARLENEAQLATVLGHEAVHFIKKHSLRQRRIIKSRSALAIGTAIAGIPFADLIAISSIYGYSRDLEREADKVGFERLQVGGYDVRESVKAFEHLHAEAKALDQKNPVFFSSHPKLQERIESYREIIAASGAPGGRIGRDVFLAKTRGVRLASLEADLSMDRYKSLILVLENKTATRRYRPEHRYYYLGEAYRHRGNEGDHEKAESAYKKAIEAAPNYAPSYRALGILRLKKNAAGARPLLKKYLRLAPNAADRAYVEHYLKSLKQGGGHP